MPRAARCCPGGMVFHVLNRGNDRKPIFHKRGDARAFLRLIAEAKRHTPMRVLAFCLMGNHWHLVLWPHDGGDGDVSAFMGWLSNAHVRRYRQHYHTSGNGHLYQGRFKSFAVEPEDRHLLMVLRYVEGNALRAGLVACAEDWPWSSLHHRVYGGAGGGAGADGVVEGLLNEWPIERPADWVRIVNEPLDGHRLAEVRTSVLRGRPLGGEAWVRQAAAAMGIAFTLRNRGRPRANGAGDGDGDGDIQNIHSPPTPPTPDADAAAHDAPLGTPK